MYHNNWLMNALTKLSMWICDTSWIQKLLVFPWNPNTLQHCSTIFFSFSSIWKLLFEVPGFALQNLTDWKYLTKDQEAVLIGWLWAVMFLSLKVSCWLSHTDGSLWPQGKSVINVWTETLHSIRQSLCFLFFFFFFGLHGPICEALPCLTKFDLWDWRFVAGARDSVLVG